MSTHRNNRTTYYKIIINVAISTFNDGNFQMLLFSNKLAILDKIMCKRTEETIYNMKT